MTFTFLPARICCLKPTARGCDIPHDGVSGTQREDRPYEQVTGDKKASLLQAPS